MWLWAGLLGLAYLYFLCLFGWATIYALFGDRWGWLFLLNSFAQYLFLPLPLLLALAWLTHGRVLWAGLAAAAVLWGYLFGRQLLPRSARAWGGDRALTAVSYNLLYVNDRPDRVVAALRASDADIVGLQELNPQIAAAVRRDLARDFPYQVLAPRDDDGGMGVISRLPLCPLDQQLPGAWLGPPQLLAADLHGTPILVLNIHAVAPRLETLEWTVRERERQARTIANFAAAHPQPLIVLGDFNAGELSTAHAIITGRLRDAWREAGWGAGHTFPGGDTPGSSRPALVGIAAPAWLVRIDYVFHSDHWRAASARIGPWDGVSDHRPVAARLLLRAPDSHASQR